MIDFSALLGAFAILGAGLGPWLVVIPGLVIGLIFGAVPGLQISMAMAIFLPMTLYMDFLQAILFLTAIFTGGGFGGGIPAILMNIPGTSSAISTAFDGYPMARRGEHNEALGLSLGASSISVIVGYLLLLALVQPISYAVLKLGPTEMLVVILWGLTMIASLSDGAVSRGLIAGFAGLLAGTIGFSDAGVLRGTMGITVLMDGIPVVPAMMGMFAASELLKLQDTKYLIADAKARRVSPRRIAAGMVHAFRYPGVLLQGSLIGIIVGAIPGVGSSVSNLLSYISAKKRDPNPESFGKGNPKGVVASESANSSSEAGSMVTLLALGIPGGGATAVMLAAFAMHNVTGGPQFIRDQTDVVYAIILANLGQALILVVLGLLLLPLLASLVKVPMNFLIPGVLSLSVFGAYGLTGNMSGPVTLLVFSAIGWAMRRQGFPIAAAVIGLILGSLGETAALHSFQISGGDPAYLLERPMTLGLIALVLGALLMKPTLRRLHKRRGGRSEIAAD
ncbi:tripartite tricarboxylate transporter permease [Salipiger thiooxidans]|uniref:tripartite tricarboxylate transporter permease n=1 Tax=Salipiger thiooxidans TaxID=282683 RepID=UPI001CD1CB47|nr:tripartite tricarboxylate transporter permease [Salipiger thiooxidans]MCA0849804.1 tripartite tricarboxylate transporter permease [Salipiger thiooxidans]